MRSKKVIGLVAVSLASVAVLAAGCGGGGGSKSLTKEEYAAKLNAICAETETKFQEVGLSDMASFAAKGDDVVAIAEDAVKEFKDVKAPDELRSASGTFNDSSDEIVDDLKNATEEAKKNDEEGFQAATESLGRHGTENDEAAKEIGADDCVSGS